MFLSFSSAMWTYIAQMVRSINLCQPASGATVGGSGGDYRESFSKCSNSGASVTRITTMITETTKDHVLDFCKPVYIVRNFVSSEN